MKRYLLKRLIYFISTLFVIALIAFAVTVCSPGDPVDRLLSGVQTGQENSQSSVANEQRVQLRHQLGLDLPLFYFSLQTAAEPDTLYKIFPASDRAALRNLSGRHGDWIRVSDYYLRIRMLENNVLAVRKNHPGANFEGLQKMNEVLENCMHLRSTTDEEFVKANLQKLEVVQSDSVLMELEKPVRDLKESFYRLTQSEKSIGSYLPVVRFHGKNQFHSWLFGDGRSRSGILRGDFGVSYISKQPVSDYILDRLPWTVFFSFFSVMLAYAISIPLATHMAKKPGGTFDNRLTAFLYLLYSLPVFWLATLLLMIFANPDVIHLFPASGIKPAAGYPEGSNFFQKAWISIPYLVLPTVCYTYSFVAVLTRLIRLSLTESMKQDYIRTARAKGLDENAVIKKHALRNALLPAVTLFAEVFPLAIGGSVLIESIFTIPGMGSGIYQSIQAQDYPVLVSIFTLTGLLTMTGYLLTDIAYAFLDPRIRFGK